MWSEAVLVVERVFLGGITPHSLSTIWPSEPFYQSQDTAVATSQPGTDFNIMYDQVTVRNIALQAGIVWQTTELLSENG